MFYAFVIFIHVVICFILIAVILLQAGRGGGLSETFGLEPSQTIFGTKMSVFLTRATVVAASLFLVTCLLLGLMTSRRGRSLIELERRKALSVPLPGVPAGETPSKTANAGGGDIPLARPQELPEE